MRFGYMVDGSSYEPQFVEAKSLEGAVALVEIRLPVSRMAAQPDSPFVEVWLDRGVARKDMSFYDLSMVYKLYPQNSGKLICGELVVGQGEPFDRENYKGFMVVTCHDAGIERQDENGEAVLCDGYFCQVYLADDDQYAFELDSFTLAAGFEIEDVSDMALDLGIKRYLDDAEDALWKSVDGIAEKLQENLLSVAPRSMIARSERLATLAERARVSEQTKRAVDMFDDICSQPGGKEVFGIANIVWSLRDNCADVLTQDEILRFTERLHEASTMSVSPLLQAERVDAVCTLLTSGVTGTRSPELPQATPEQIKEVLLTCDMDTFIDLVDVAALDNQQYYAMDCNGVYGDLERVEDAIQKVVARKPDLDRVIEGVREATPDDGRANAAVRECECI